MHILNGSWRPERGRPTKRKAHLSLNRENTKRKVEHSNLPSKEQLPVDYSIGNFFLCMHQCGQNFYKILSAVSVESMNLVYNFLMRLGTLQK